MHSEGVEHSKGLDQSMEINALNSNYLDIKDKIVLHSKYSRYKFSFVQYNHVAPRLGCKLI